MSRQTMVNTFIWDDPWYSRKKPNERYVFLYLLTNSLTNLAGIYEITDERIARDTGIETREITAILAIFEKDGKAYRWHDWIIMRNWPKHQNTKSPKIQAGIDRILGELPVEILDILREIGYPYRLPERAAEPKTDPKPDEKQPPEGYPIDTVSIPYPYPIKPVQYGMDTQSPAEDTISHFTTLHFTSRDQAAPKPPPGPGVKQELKQLDLSTSRFEQAKASLFKTIVEGE